MKVLKIGAVWCNSCNVMRPRWQNLEAKYEWLNTEYVEYDENPEVIANYDIEEEKLPVFIFLDSQGQELERISGEPSEKDLEELIFKYKDE